MQSITNERLPQIAPAVDLGNQSMVASYRYKNNDTTEDIDELDLTDVEDFYQTEKQELCSVYDQMDYLGMSWRDFY